MPSPMRVKVVLSSLESYLYNSKMKKRYSIIIKYLISLSHSDSVHDDNMNYNYDNQLVNRYIEFLYYITLRRDTVIIQF
jgi:hypothetical protein